MDRARVDRRAGSGRGAVGAEPVRLPPRLPSSRADVLALQRTAGNRAVRGLLRFSELGHKRIGDVAWGTDQLELGPGLKVSFGDAVALGDHFGSFAALWRIAGTPGKSIGQQGEVRYVLWNKIWNSDKSEKERRRLEAEKLGVWYDKKAKFNRDLAYNVLKSRNISHFPYPRTGGGRDLKAYREGHEDAMRKAFEFGRRQKPQDEALLTDAFACHFLTDAFSGSHATTSRESIKQHWDKKVPNFDKKLIRFLADKIAEGYPWYKRIAAVALLFPGGRISEQARDQLAASLTGFTFGDVVGFLVHDAEGEAGAQADVAGKPINLADDAGLDPPNLGPDAQRTLSAASDAVKASIDEIHGAFDTGWWYGRSLTTYMAGLTKGDGLYAAERLAPIPRKRAPGKGLFWQHASVNEFLDDPKIGTALVSWGKQREKDFRDGLADLKPDARNALTKALIDPLASGKPERIRKLLRDILNH